MKFLLFLFISFLTYISAHVSVSPTQIPNSGTALLTFNIGHSCAQDALTYKMVFMFPPNITSVKPVWKAGWTLNETSVMLGYKTSAGIDAFRIVYTFTALPGSEVPTWAVDTMLFRVTVPTGSAAWSVGSIFYIPVYQYCTGGLLDAWNNTKPSSSSSDSGPLPSPSITILDPTAIQQNPTQQNVQALASQIAALSSPPSSSSSSSWLRADTISVIAIILAGLSILSSFILITRLQRVEKQNFILRQKLQQHNDASYVDKKLSHMEMTPTSTETTTPSAQPASAPASASVPAPATAPTPVTTTTRESTSEGHDDDADKPQFRFHNE